MGTSFLSWAIPAVFGLLTINFLEGYNIRWAWFTVFIILLGIAMNTPQVVSFLNKVAGG